MILDTYSLLSDDQDLAQAAGTYYSNVLNLYGDPGYTTSADAPNGVAQSLGKGYPVELLVQITETFTSGGAATLVVSLEVDDNEGFASATTVVSSTTFALADLVAGTYLLPQHVPYGVNEQYVRVKYVIGTAATTAGKVTAGVVMGHQSNR
jgi:hypothetical protein